jgi:methyl-accepting chemotaxis protein
MNLRGQVLSIGLSGAIAAVLVGLIGLTGVNRVAHSFEESLSMGLALQSNQKAAMAHVAIRGDVVIAILGSMGSDKSQVESGQKSLVEHSTNFKEALDELDSLPLSSDSKSVIKATRPLLEEYVAAANRVLEQANSGSVSAGSMMRFLRKFNEVEAQIAVQVGTISAEVDRFGVSAKAAVEKIRYLVVGILAISTVLLILGSLHIAGIMARQMKQTVFFATTLAEGDLTGIIEEKGNVETKQLLAAMKLLQVNLIEMVRNAKINADALSSASFEIAEGNNDLSARTEGQASALEETAATMEELSSTVKKNAESAHETRRLALNASAVASQGGDVVEQVVQTMKGINESSSRIADIIGLIDSIAFQTNILALNAAVEAARAGEQGRGFAVVATEVRSLAGRSADAAKEIKVLIGSSVGRVEQGTILVDQAGIKMAEVVQCIRQVSDVVGTISAASNEQAAAVAQIDESITHMDNATQQNAALVEEMAAAASSLNFLAQEQVKALSAFKLEANMVESYSSVAMPMEFATAK